MARRKLDQLNAAATLDFLRAPPGNRLEALKGDRLGQHSIRVNDQFRLCLVWTAQGPKDVEIVHFGVKPIYWMDSCALSVSVEHWWRTPEGKLRTCEPTFTITFDAQRHALLAKAEEPPKEIGRKVESPKGTFFLEELDAPTKNELGERIDDKEVWIVSAKDPATREPLPDFHENEGIDVLQGAAISPDENSTVSSAYNVT